MYLPLLSMHNWALGNICFTGYPYGYGFSDFSVPPIGYRYGYRGEHEVWRSCMEGSPMI